MDEKGHLEGGPELAGHRAEVLAVVMLPSLHTVVTASADHTLRVWNLRGEGGCTYTLEGHSAEVCWAALASQTLASLSFRGLARSRSPRWRLRQCPAPPSWSRAQMI